MPQNRLVGNERKLRKIRAKSGLILEIVHNIESVSARSIVTYETPSVSELYGMQEVKGSSPFTSTGYLVDHDLLKTIHGTG